MNTTFEDQLREDLRAAAGHAAYGSVDPVHVIAEGTRLVRQRRRRQGIGATATAVLLAVGGFVATDQGRTTTEPPAGPSTTATAAPVSRALLDLSDDGTARLIAERDAGSDEVRIIDASGTDRRVLTRLRVPVGSEHITYVPLTTRDVLVGLMPHGSQLLQVITDGAGDTGGYGHDTRTLGPDLVLFGVRFDDPSRLDTLSRILWRDSAGTVWDTNTPLPSARFDFPGTHGGSQLVWVSADRQTWGVSDQLAGTLSDKPLEPYSLNSMGSFTAAGQGRKQGMFTVAGLLPFAGATDLRASWAPGVTVVSPLQAQELTSGDPTNLTAIDAVVRTDGELPDPLLRSITFTGPDGKQHSHRYTARSGG